MGKVIRTYHFDQMTGITEFRRALRLGDLHIPVAEDTSVLGSPLSAGRMQIPNAIAIQPLEGCDCTRSGAPSELTKLRYERYARGGAGMIWFEACAVSADGRDTPSQMYLHEGSVREMRRMVSAVDQAAEAAWGRRPCKVLQLTHSGRASTDANGRPRPAAVFTNPYLDAYNPGLAIVSDERLAQLEDEMAHAAFLAAEAGFDAVDIKLCHNYLTRELLAAFTRQGPYGGSFENRTRWVRNVIAKIKKTVGDGIELAVRLNAYDAIPYPYGWGMAFREGVMEADLEEPKRLMTLLHRQGVNLFNISSMMPRCAPAGRGYLALYDPDAPILPWAGVETLLQATRELKRAVPGAAVVASGLSWFQQFGANVGAGGVRERWFDVAGFGRQALADPMFAARILNGEGLRADHSCLACDLCYRCLERGLPVGCLSRDPAYRRMGKPE